METEKAVYPGAGTHDDPYVVTFAEGDPENPKNWKKIRKWTYMLIYSAGMMSGTFAVSSYTSGFAGMTKQFGTTHEILAVGQFLFLVGVAIGSMVWPAIGDLLGRRRMVIVTLVLFTAFSVGTAAANNMATVLVSRFFSAFFSAGIQTAGPACLSALFYPQEIAVPFVVAAISPFLGPSVGPLVGGYVTEYTGSWRNINWVAVGFAGVVTVLSAFVPELHAPHLLRARAVRLSKASGQVYMSSHDIGFVIDLKTEARAFLVKPFVYLIKEPIALLLSAYIAFLYAILQLYFTAFPIIYQQQRHWSQGSAGLPFIALIVGYVLAVPTTMICSRPYLKRLRQDGYAAPEHRLYFAMLAAVLLPISLFWMAWTARPSVHWLNPVIAGGIFGFGQIGITMSCFVYFADMYTVHVGAVFAGMNFLRYSVGGIFPLFVLQMYDRLGVPWACSLLGFLLLAFMPAPFIFFGYGAAIRSRSRLATAKSPTPKRDIEIDAGAEENSSNSDSSTLPPHDNPVRT